LRLSLYIHIPFCRYKCAYCDFISYPLLEESIEERYVDRVIEEMRWWHQMYSDATIYTVYIGGGTPSALPLPLQERLFREIKHLWGEDFNEFTVEANPEDVSPVWVDLIQSYGISRVSVGVETLSPALLAAWNRHHSVDAAISAVTMLLDAGINTNVDMIYPTYLPKEVSFSFRKDMETIVGLMPHHLSVYMLDVHEGTLAHTLVENGMWQPIDDDSIIHDMAWLYEYLSSHGYIHYEISNFALTRGK